MLLWCRFLWKLEQRLCKIWPHTAKSQSGRIIFCKKCPSLGPLSCNPKFHCLPLRLNVLLCPWPYKMPLQLWNCLMKLEARISKSYALNPLYTAKCLRTTPVHLNLLTSQSNVQELNTSMFTPQLPGSCMTWTYQGSPRKHWWSNCRCINQATYTECIFQTATTHLCCLILHS